MKIPMLDLSRQHDVYRSELITAAHRVIDHGQYILGAEVSGFESALSARVNDAHVVGVSSGTDALLVALMALDVGPGTEVVLPAFSFFATAGVVARLGAKPVFVDICPKTFNADDQTIAEGLSARTKAVMPVYLFGQMTRVSPVHFRECNIPVIEDAAQSLGARTGHSGLAQAHAFAATSFFPTKNLGGLGDGGAVITRDTEMAQRLRTLRAHGAKTKYTHDWVGGNFRLDAIQAAFLSVKLKYLEKQIESRRALAHQYDDLFSQAGLIGTGDLQTPFCASESHHTYNQYVLRCSDRDGLKSYLAKSNVASMIYYPSPLHLQPCFADLGYSKGAFPHAEKACDEVLALPCFPGMSADEQSYVVELIRRFYR
jgi:dTDP-4-amino-4,6-dideoxygalactose transaminase